MSAGLFAQPEYGDGSEGFIVRWTRWGGAYTLELQPGGLLIRVPTRSDQTIPLADVEQGMGQHAIVQHFGAGALQQVRNEIWLLGAA